MNFFDRMGKIALGSRIRVLGEKFGEDAKAIYAIYGAEFQPKWFPVFYLLYQTEVKTASLIAESIGHSHASVSKTLAEMSRAGLTFEKSDPDDRRSTIISLTKRGREIGKKIEIQCADVEAAVEQMSAEATRDLWATLEEWESLLAKNSFLNRVLEVKKQRESARVRIEEYQPKFRKAFHDLNREWITKHFRMEKPDIEVLENPKKYILGRGGFIFVATIDKEPVGVCALIPLEKSVYELAKMAVSPAHRGKSIGWQLGRAIVEKARQLKAVRIYLESNTALTAAINLYKKLGFKKVNGHSSPYERCNIQMELDLVQKPLP